MIKKILILLLVAFIAIQFFRPAKNINTATAATANNISKVFYVPDSVHSILKTSCTIAIAATPIILGMPLYNRQHGGCRII